MNPWPFVTAAYVLVLGAGALVGWLSYRAMRKHEK
ncbi:hypothetical protein FHY02_000442 [Sphingomonas sp. BK069]|nr:hypothetical protein [Sphingomonas sp. BK069]MBB3475608.1 hypothetical protein [Sphingomonas sp. BK345]